MKLIVLGSGKSSPSKNAFLEGVLFSKRFWRTSEKHLFFDRIFGTETFSRKDGDGGQKSVGEEFSVVYIINILEFTGGCIFI